MLSLILAVAVSASSVDGCKEYAETESITLKPFSWYVIACPSVSLMATDTGIGLVIAAETAQDFFTSDRPVAIKLNVYSTSDKMCGVCLSEMPRGKALRGIFRMHSK